MKPLLIQARQVRFTWVGWGVVLLASCAATVSSDTPGGFSLEYAQDFADAHGLEGLVFSDPHAWEWSEGALALSASSAYQPPYRSPHSIALVEGLAFGDFVLEAELMQTGREYGHRDLCLFFGFENPERFYYVHLATLPDDRAHNVFLVDAAARRPLAPVAEVGVDWSGGWHRVRLSRIDGRIRVFFDDMEEPVIETEDATLALGRVGFGSFDDTGRVRNVRIWAPSVAAAAGDPFRL